MTWQRIVPVIASVLVIIFVAVAQERSRYLAAIVAAMPLTAPLAMWVVFSATQGDYQQTAYFVRSMVFGLAATLIFIIACWFALRQRWSFPLTLIFGYGVWAAIVLIPVLAERLNK
jgi:uncharacterized membrane protein (GlpM family)